MQFCPQCERITDSNLEPPNTSVAWVFRDAVISILGSQREKLQPVVSLRKCGVIEEAVAVQ